MLLFMRIVACTVGIAAAAFAVNAFEGRARFWSDPIGIAIELLLIAIAVLGVWAAVRGARPNERVHIGFTLGIGLLVGFVGFVVGFAGPLIFMPESNQGPLLGIFLTGPLGFFLGCVGGFLWTRLKA